MNLPALKNGILTRRRFMFSVTVLATLYPLLRFIGFKVPKKPEYKEIATALTQRDYLITSDFILFDRDDDVWAFPRRCTHLGFKVHYLDDQDILQCPCHHSQFHARTGSPLKGPAKKDLVILEVEKRDSAPFYVVTT